MGELHDTFSIPDNFLSLLRKFARTDVGVSGEEQQGLLVSEQESVEIELLPKELVREYEELFELTYSSIISNLSFAILMMQSMMANTDSTT